MHEDLRESNAGLMRAVAELGAKLDRMSRRLAGGGRI